MPVVEGEPPAAYRTTTGTPRRRSLDGELFGLLGPGKTTTIKMLITLLIPTSGTARVLGRSRSHGTLERA